MALEPYVFFPGTCAQAIAFYQQALGAELLMPPMLFRDSPDPVPPGLLPPGWEDKIMHCSLRLAGGRLMVSDGNSETNAPMHGFSLTLSYPSQAQAHAAFAALAATGEVTMPIGPTFWSPCFGMVKDHFGVHWMITVEEGAAQ